MTLQTRITDLAQAVGTDIKAIQAGTATKQAELVSGSNIKTINDQPVLGSGDVHVPTVALDGPTSMVAGDPAVSYTITDWSSFSAYTVSATAGAVSIAGNHITYTAPAVAQSVTLTVTRDSVPNGFTIVVTKPAYELATPEPTPAAFGAPLEGGFYAGMIWNQATQSTTSTTIATGTQTFAVADMTSAPFAYVGQQLEVRSRANPANNMAGTVSAITATSITLNVTSVGGSGTFSDWSIMARYRVIVAPKSSGENAGIALKNDTTAMPVTCKTITEGWLSTISMVSAGSSSVYPAAHWARGLNISGYTDWYIPARDELELCCRNLKPGADTNYTSTRSVISTSILGAYGDSTNAMGTNRNSSPVGEAYTGTNPAQISSTNFQYGGAEALTASFYWSSSDYSTGAWGQYTSSPNYGYQSTGWTKSSGKVVRAVRRSII